MALFFLTRAPWFCIPPVIISIKRNIGLALKEDYSCLPSNPNRRRNLVAPPAPPTLPRGASIAFRS